MKNININTRCINAFERSLNYKPLTIIHYIFQSLFAILC